MLLCYPDGPGRFSLAQELIRLGCDLNARQIRRQVNSTILQLIVRIGNPNRLGLLRDLIKLRAIQPEGLLHLAAENAPVSFLEALFAGSVPGINSTDPKGYTPAQVAASRTDPDAAKVLSFLARKGADMNGDLFKFVTRPEVAGCILELGADVNRTDADGKSPLYWAVIGDNDGVANQLLERGADVHQLGPQGENCLQVAWTPEMLELLIGYSPSLPLINGSGQYLLDSFLGNDDIADQDFQDMVILLVTEYPEAYLST